VVSTPAARPRLATPTARTLRMRSTAHLRGVRIAQVHPKHCFSTSSPAEYW
jgi:hypothetical protein